MDGRKVYRFTVRWGEERDTDDVRRSRHADERGAPTAGSDRSLAAAVHRYHRAGATALLRYQDRGRARLRPGARGRRGGTRAATGRDPSARADGDADADHSVFAAECGKGTYVRALARDMGRALGTHGHVSALRRAGVGPFDENHAIPLEKLQAAAPAEGGSDIAPLVALLRPIAAGLQTIPSVSVSRADAARLARGQPILLRGRDAPILQRHGRCRLYPWRPDRAGRRREQRTASAPHFQPGLGWAALRG